MNMFRANSVLFSKDSGNTLVTPDKVAQSYD